MPVFKTKEASPSTECRNIDEHPLVAAAWAKLEAAKRMRPEAYARFVKEDKEAQAASTRPGSPSGVELAAAKAAHEILANFCEKSGLPPPPEPALRADIKAKRELEAIDAAIAQAERDYHQAQRDASPDVCRALHRDRLPIQQRVVNSMIELLKSFAELEDFDAQRRSQGLVPTSPWRSVNWSTLPSMPQLLRKFRHNGGDFRRNNAGILADKAK